MRQRRFRCPMAVTTAFRSHLLRLDESRATSSSRDTESLQEEELTREGS